ncbi:sugar phosphate nucleotidyltransferase [Niallia sp. 03133]|uniref:sugar phosphate nucleotidyltransferase n=1 Tax=Niallia sp. 03133 TaxID=3458060 RepID=UPI004044C0D9
MLLKTMLGVIDATTYQDDLEELIAHRSLAALPIGGRYRLIDFVLSNMVNSGIGSVAIFPKYQYRSLMDHLGSGKNWDLDRKRDGLFFFPASITDGTSRGIGSFNHFAANIDYFFRSKQEYALVANCFTVFNMNFSPVLTKHLQSGCDITEIRHNGSSLEMYLIKKTLLIDLVQNRDVTGYTCMKDVLMDIHHNYKICDYEYSGYAEKIDSISNYFRVSKEILKTNIWTQLFKKESPIFTKVKDEPPTRYTNTGKVKNSMIANGCVIEGEIENSVVARAVKIGKGSVLKNCIIMQKCTIGENCMLDSVILDKDVTIENGAVMTGSINTPFVIRKGTVQGALMNS